MAYLASPRLLRQRIVLFIRQQNLKKYISRLKVKKQFCKGEKSIPVVSFTKSNSSEQSIYRNRRLINVTPGCQIQESQGVEWLK
jgi:hypothetical protein